MHSKLSCGLFPTLRGCTYSISTRQYTSCSWQAREVYLMAQTIICYSILLGRILTSELNEFVQNPRISPIY